VANGSKGKRRRGAQKAAPRPAAAPVQPTQPVGQASVTNRLPVVPWLVAGGIAVVALIAILVVFRPGTGTGGGAVASASPSASGAASPGSSGVASPGGSGVAAGACPTSQPPALPAGETRTVTLTTPKGAMVIKVEADLSPIAAGNFVALASCGFYDGTVFHRTPTLADGTPFVIQGGDPDGNGSGGPGYEIQDEPVTTPYRRGTVAMARSSAPNSVGSQFFIVLDDKDGQILGSANTYQIIGNVTSGMEVADAIFVASAGVELPENPVPITTATVANP
jgi:cyclophilin family peptidyl-prolyl cis-trans isomerase